MLNKSLNATFTTTTTPPAALPYTDRPRINALILSAPAHTALTMKNVATATSKPGLRPKISEKDA